MRRASFEARLLRLEQSRVTAARHVRDIALPSWFDAGAIGASRQTPVEWAYRALPVAARVIAT